MTARRDEQAVLSARGRRLRLGAAAALAVLTLAGTVRGQDSDFPFGPFRMYATRDDPNGVVIIAAVQTVGRDGRIADVTNADGAPRRAEIEGRMGEFQADCAAFAAIAGRYSPSGDGTAVRLVQVRYRLRDGRRAERTDDVVCTVPRPSRTPPGTR